LKLQFSLFFQHYIIDYSEKDYKSMIGASV
jgi:hypothetical protein